MILPPLVPYQHLKRTSVSYGGHGKKYSELDEEERYWRDIWSKTRTSILDLGNSNLRAAQSEISQYTISWNRYVTNFVIKDNEEF